MFKNMFKKRFFIRTILFFLITVILTACQPTPDRAAVVYGRDLQEKIERSSASIEAYEAPETWTETLDMKGSDTKVEIDATISVPNVTAFPVYKVVETSISSESIQSLVDYFVEDRQVVEYSGPTKDQIEEALILARKDGDEQMVGELEKLINNAPNTVKPEYITNWTLANGEKEISGYIETDKGYYSWITVGTDKFRYSNGNIQTESQLSMNWEAGIGDVGISPENAAAAAEKVLCDLGINDMAVFSMEKTEIYLRKSINVFSGYNEDYGSKGYLINFAHNIDGIPARISEMGGYHYMDEFAYTAPFYPEEIQVCVDEEGKVQTFSWHNPLKIIDTLTENAALLQFEDIQDRIRDMLFFINSYDDSPAKVEYIEMNMTLVNVKDELDKAMYVPAWYIHYNKEYTMPQSGSADTTHVERVLILNAIDGGRVLEYPPDPEIQRIMEEERENNP